MAPKSLAEWSVEAITALLVAGNYESEEFDFKQSLPHARDDTGKVRLRAACCAFANSGGGYLVFGIDNDKTKPPQDRLVGLDQGLDFPASFGDYSRLCAPSVYWTFRNPPLTLPSNRKIHVVYIPRSWRAPHAVGDADQGWRFPKRTNKGTEGMTTEEIRTAFLTFYEKRLRLQLLDAELMALQESSKVAYVNRVEEIESKYSLVTFEMQTIDAVVADTYPLTAGHSALLATLRQLRQAVIVANNKARIFYSTATLSFTKKGKMIREHNEFMAHACARIGELADRARTLLQPLLVV